MIEQILVEVTHQEGHDTNTTYITIQDDTKGLIKTEVVNEGDLKNHAEYVLDIARNYKINTIKIDIHGIGLGLFDWLMVKVGEKNCNRKTGSIQVELN